ncbi:MAG: multiheme c-type cytochrome [Planctomycetaceae bacterium]
MPEPQCTLPFARVTSGWIPLASCSLLLFVIPAKADDGMAKIESVVGTEQAKCQQCHPSEVAHWQKTSHFRSLARLEYSGNSKKYADALGISADTLKTTSICSDCHGTKAVVDSAPQVISGVSCESCHGGAKGWLKSHGEYADGQTFSTLAALRVARKEETEGHRVARLASTKAAGMIRPDMLHELATNCLSCHVVNNEKLILAGHKASSAFELTSWLNGEVRHNFFMDANQNAEAPSLWSDVHGATAQQRNRMKFTVGTFVELETALKRRAKATNPTYIAQIGGVVAASNGRLTQTNALSMTPQTQSATAVVPPLFATLFAPMPNDDATYSAAAAKIEELTTEFIKQHDGTKLQGLDALINGVPPHYSQQFKEQQLIKN